MGCICSIVASFISNILYFSSKFLYCFTCAALVSCFVMTLLLTLGMGIGIGYNYCYVDFKTVHRYVPAKYRKYNPTPKWRRSVIDESFTESVNVDSNVHVTETATELAFTTNVTNVSKDANITEARVENSTEENTKKTTLETMDDSPKMIIPISGLDLIALLSKLRSENRNYSLQIVTT